MMEEMSSQLRNVDPIAALREARLSGVALAAFPLPIPATLADAYAMQGRLIAALDAPVLGWKVGRIAPALVDDLGADRMAGPVLRIARLNGDSPGAAPVFVGGTGAIEAEIMLRLRAIPDGPVSAAEDGAAWIDEIRVGFEVASSPAPDVQNHAPYSVIADIGINNGILIGPPVSIDDFMTLAVETRIDGSSVGTGRAIDVLDGPWGSLSFLVDLHRRGVIALGAGQWISAGAITGVHPVVVGETATAHFGPAVEISCRAVADTGFRT
jgi:2-keto-4-pentenoate hydratase